MTWLWTFQQSRIRSFLTPFCNLKLYFSFFVQNGKEKTITSRRAVKLDYTAKWRPELLYNLTMKDTRNLLGINPVWKPHAEIAKWTFQTIPRNGIVLSVHSHEIIFTYYVILYDFLRYFIPKNIIFDYRMRLKMNEYNSFKIFIVNLYNNSTFCFSVESILMTLSDIFVFLNNLV